MRLGVGKSEGEIRGILVSVQNEHLRLFGEPLTAKDMEDFLRERIKATKETLLSSTLGTLNIEDGLRAISLLCRGGLEEPKPEVVKEPDVKPKAKSRAKSKAKVRPNKG